MRLEIADESFNLKVKDELWKRFLKKKYRDFLVEDGLVRFEIEIVVRDEDDFLVEFSEDLLKAKVYVPGDLSSFLDFNFFLKTVVSSFLLQVGGFLIHSSAVATEQGGFLFAGKQGAGKSTVIDLIKQQSFKPLNDDFAVVREVEGEYFVFTSPFYEKNKLEKEKMKIPIKKVFFLMHGKENRLEELGKADALGRAVSLVLTPISLPSFGKKERDFFLDKALSVAEGLVYNTSCYLLYFKPDKTFLELL